MPPLTTTTFVTAFFKIYDGPPLIERTMEWRLQNFEKLANTNIPLLIYTCEEYLILLAPYLEKYPNLRIGKIMEFTESETWKSILTIEETTELSLPEKRCLTKDTKEYIALMNAKTEFMKYAIEENPWNSTHFAWIDFNIFHIFKTNVRYPTEFLRSMAKRELQQEDFLVVPGCWDYNWTNEWSIPNEVCWRFCGGFFLGTANAMLNFHRVYETHLSEFLRTFRVLTWEVNFWSWLELNKYFSPMWYHADHNASILEFSVDVCCIPLQNTISRRYTYPNINDFLPTSTCYIRIGDKDVINTRFVNYTILENGCYVIRDPQQNLHSRNMVSILDDVTGIESTGIEFTEMVEEEGMNYGGRYYGLEDIRLYHLIDDEDTTIRFVCSNSNHIPNLKIRMMTGIYDIENAVCKDMRILHPPTDTGCEKNWIPLPTVVDNMEAGEYFIYRWMPLEIGRLDETDQLRIVRVYAHETPFFKNVRGSSCLIEVEDGYMCVVHFSEEKYPRHYFHLLVLLERGSFRPLKYSRFFYFHEKSIEFCIGFKRRDHDHSKNYCFWISNFDRDPEYLEVPCETIDLCYDIVY